MARIAGNRTLGEVRASYTSKPAFNKAMRMDARDRLLRTGIENECFICGETRQVDICHIKPISEFDDETLIEVVNGPENNIVLCPLHHRLLDNNMLDLANIKKDKVRKGIHIILEFNTKKEKNEKIQIAKNILNNTFNDNNKFNDVTIWVDK